MRERVLVVDDAPEIRNFLAEYILKPRGFEVFTAVNGLEGLTLAISKKPDLIILDMQLPRLNGFAMLEKLQERGMEIPTILITAHGSEDIAVKAFRMGIRDYVIKPFDADEMNFSIDRALRETRVSKQRDQLLAQVVDNNNLLKKRLQELNTLYSIGKSVSSSLDVEEVLHRVIEAAVFLTNADEGLLMLLDEESNELYVRASKNLDSATRSMRLRVNDGLAGRVMQTKEPIVAGQNAQWQKIITSYLVRSLIYVPLLVKGVPIGVLSVVNRVKDAMFDKRMVRGLSMLADYAAVAISNANLYSQSDKERNRLRQILGQTDDPVLIIDEAENIVLVNEAARRALEMPAGNLTHKPVREGIHNQAILQFLTQLINEKFSSQAEITSHDGRTFNANMTLIEGLGRSIFMRDITKLKELDQLKSDFVAAVSHDLRSPLNVILSYAELLERSGELNLVQKEMLQQIKASVYNTSNLISELLDLGRLESGQELEAIPCDVGKILNDIVAELAPTIQNKPLNLRMDIAEDTPIVMGEPYRLQQAFANLLDNAIKYTPARGNISIKAKRNGQYLQIQVADSGIGISSEDLPFIFDKFYRARGVTRSHVGTGLGLSIVKAIIERHNGQISAESEPNRGSIFTVKLPLQLGRT